jgi:hypothetical protein
MASEIHGDNSTKRFPVCELPSFAEVGHDRATEQSNLEIVFFCEVFLGEYGDTSSTGGSSVKRPGLKMFSHYSMIVACPAAACYSALISLMLDAYSPTFMDTRNRLRRSGKAN